MIIRRRSVPRACVSVAGLWCALAIAAFSNLGCEQKRVRVEMDASDGSVARSFATNVLDDDGVRRLADAYGSGPQRDGRARGVRFEGRFGTDLPREVGNRSGLDEVTSPLGSTWFYFEAFGEGGGRHGDDWAALMQRMHAGDLWVRLFGRWAERQLPAGEERERFRRAIEQELVPMARNVMLRYGAMQAVAQSQRIGGRLRDADEEGERSDDESFWQRVFVPLLLAMGEEGIFTPAELQRLFLLSLDGRAGGDSRQWALDEIFLPATTRLVRRFRPDVERVTTGQMLTMGISFWFFATNSTERNDILLASPAIDEREKARIRAGARSVRLPPPFGIEPRRRVPTTDAEVRLRVAAVPYLTNGVVEKQPDGRIVVVFRSAFTDADNRTVIYEPVYFAAWSDPAIERQRSIFGSVLLDGEALAEFCLWHEMLTEPERRAFAEGLERLHAVGDTAGIVAVIRAVQPRRSPPKALIAWLEARRGPA